MRGAGRSVLLVAFLAVALGALVVLVASLQAPVPGGGMPEGSASRKTAPAEESEPCPEPTAAAPAGAGAAGLPMILVPGRPRWRLAGLAGLALFAAGCVEVECRPAAASSPSEGAAGGGGDGGSGGGQGGGEGRGTGRGTEPDPVKVDPRALWIVLAVLAAVLLVALLAAAARARKGARAPPARGAEDAGEDAAAGVPSDVLDALASMRDGNARAVVAAYVEACAALARQGVARRAWETARELAQRAPPDRRAAMTRLTGIYEAARHGGIQPSDEAVRAAQDLARQVAQAPPAAPEVHARG